MTHGKVYFQPGSPNKSSSIWREFCSLEFAAFIISLESEFYATIFGLLLLSEAIKLTVEHKKNLKKIFSISQTLELGCNSNFPPPFCICISKEFQFACESSMECKYAI
jgi:hypothetical protein